MTKKKIAILVVVLVLIAAVGGVAGWLLTADSRTYKDAVAAYDSEDFQTAANLFESLGNYKDSESRYQSCQYELTTDRRFLRTMAKGLEERRATADEISGDTVSMQKMILAELANLKEFKNVAFEDEHLQQDAADYIQALENSVDALAYQSSDIVKYETMWDECYIQRSKVIVDLYTNYALPVSDDYEDAILEFSNKAKAAQAAEDEKNALIDVLKNHMTVEVTNVEYDGFMATYETDVYIDNIADFDIDNFYFEVDLYSGDGSKTNEYTNELITSVRAGKTEKAHLEIFTEDYDPAATIRIDYSSITCIVGDHHYEKLPIE